MQSQEIAILINCLVIVLSIITAILVIRFVKIEQSGYKLLFITYTLFWIPLMLCRQYTGVMANAITNETLKDNDWQLWLPMAAYGFIGIFARLFADYFTFLRHNRKSMIYLALVIGLITFIPIIFVQNVYTNIIQSLGVGVGASMIGTYQLMFNEQHGKSKQFLTVSLLSIPPLIADFISSAIQSTITSIDTNFKDHPDVSILRYLWIVGICVIVITFVIAFFIKENRMLLYSDNKYKKQIEKKNEWIYFVLICFLGSLIAFVKWANSGAIAQLTIGKYATNIGQSSASYGGYLSLLFSVGQLIGGLLTGLFLINKIGKAWTFSIGCTIWVVYEILGMYVHNPYSYLGIHILNGFSYGVVYNLILGFILQKTFKTNKQSPMGVYQSVMSIGIMFSQFFTGWLKSGPLNKNRPIQDFIKASEIINWIVIAGIVLAWIIFMYTWIIEKLNYQRLWFKKNIKE